MTDSSPNRRYRVPGHVRVRRSHREAMLINLDSLECFGLDEVGLAVWDGLERHGQPAQVVGELLARFDVEEARLRHDVFSLVDHLVSKGLLAVETGGGQ